MNSLPSPSMERVRFVEITGNLATSCARQAGLVDCERRGTWVHYWPMPERLQWISALLSAPEAALAH
jgi:hypothetical protein